MHEFIMNIGRWVLELCIGLKDAAYITMVGWLGIFVVMAVIILLVWLLNKIES